MALGLNDRLCLMDLAIGSDKSLGQVMVANNRAAAPVRRLRRPPTCFLKKSGMAAE
jgi:hypothetical protein